jgi:peptidoglycan/LPS O-acetylase OafA/YrhL
VPATLSLVDRYRSGTPVERQQIKWLLVGAVAFAIGLVAAVAMDTVTENRTLYAIVVPVGMSLFPITIGIAVFRYRLFEVDRFISRTVAYALVVVFLAGVFVTGVVWIPNAAGLGDSPLLVAASTLAVAAIFNPLRRRTQVWVDRRFNRSHYDAARVLESFAGSLQARVDPDGVMYDLVEVVREAMQPASVGAWVRDRP